jgi:fatty acid-binding protein DegV
VLSAKFESPNIWQASLGPVLGTHVGPGTVGAAAFVSE